MNLTKQRLFEMMNKVSGMPLSEVDWKNDFNDVQKTCMNITGLKDYLNGVLKNHDKKPNERVKADLLIHNKSIPKLPNDEIDVDAFIANITKIPDKIISDNAKMEKSETDESISFNIGVPALRGLVCDIEEQMFYVVNTCPGAGSCAVVCYARRGNYVILPNVFIKQTRVLNLLLNNPDLFKKLLYGELERVCLVNKNKKIIFRWDDAGDFFSKKYYEIALEITKGLKSAGYSFESYGYTKMGDIYNLADPNMLLSFSTDGNRTEKGKVDLNNAKTAEIVPKDLFRDLFVMNKGNFAVENEKLIPVSADSINTLKQRIAGKFGVDVKSLLTYDEMIRTKPQEGVIWNVITMPKGDGDVTAQRRDIKRSFLLIH